MWVGEVGGDFRAVGSGNYNAVAEQRGRDKSHLGRQHVADVFRGERPFLRVKESLEPCDVSQLKVILGMLWISESCVQPGKKGAKAWRDCQTKTPSLGSIGKQAH
jgi:hypothetical protein